MNKTMLPADKKICLLFTMYLILNVKCLKNFENIHENIFSG